MSLNIARLEAALAEYEARTMSDNGTRRELALSSANARGIQAVKEPKTKHLWASNLQNQFVRRNSVKKYKRAKENDGGKRKRPDVEATPTTGKRGRPAGSKNKPKPEPGSSAIDGNSTYSDYLKQFSDQTFPSNGSGLGASSSSLLMKSANYSVFDNTSNRSVVVSAADRKKMTFWTEVCGPYFLSVDEIGILPKNYREMSYQAEKLASAERCAKDLAAMEKRHALNAERRKRKGPPASEAREMREMQLSLAQAHRDVTMAQRHPGKIEKIKKDDGLVPLGPRGQHFREVWAAEDQAIQDALNPGAARRRARYEQQQERRKGKDSSGRGSRSSKRASAVPKNTPFKEGEVCHVLMPKGEIVTVRITKKHKGGTFDVKYIVGKNRITGVERKQLFREGETPEEDDEDKEDDESSYNGLGEGKEGQNGLSIRTYLRIDGEDPVPNRSALKNLDGSVNTDFVLRCWTDDSLGGGERENSGGKRGKKGAGNVKLVPIDDRAEDATTWVPVPYDGTAAGIEMSKDNCGAITPAVPKLLAGHSLFFGKGGARLKNNKPLRSFGADEVNDQVNITLTDLEVMEAVPREEVDEVAAEMGYLQWKLGVTQKLNEGMAETFKARVELEMLKEQAMNKRLKALQTAKETYEARFNTDQERIRRLRLQEFERRRAAEIKRRREIALLQQKSKVKRSNNLKNNRNRTVQRREEIARATRETRSTDKQNLKKTMFGTTSGPEDEVRTLLESCVGYVVMCNTPALVPKVSPEEEARRAAEKAKKAEKVKRDLLLKKKIMAEALEAKAKKEKARKKRMDDAKKRKFEEDLTASLYQMGREFEQLHHYRENQRDAAKRRKKNEKREESEQTKLKQLCSMANKLLGAKENSQGEQRYCLCRTVQNDDKFYICCDICEDWFHASCSGVPAAVAKDIDAFVCPICQIISARFHTDKSKWCRTSFKPSVDISLLGSYEIYKYRKEALLKASSMIEKIEDVRYRRQLAQLKRFHSQMLAKVKRKKPKDRPLIKIRLRKVGPREYRHVNPRSKVGIPHQKTMHEIEEAIPLMPLRVKFMKLKPTPPGDSVEDGGRKCGIPGCKRDWKVSGPEPMQIPKRRRSAISLFTTSVRKKTKAENPKLGRTELTELIHRRWEEAKDDEKKEFEEKAQQLKAEYDQHKAKLKAELKSAKKASKMKIAKQWPTRPKRPANPYFMFCSTLRAELRQKNPGISTGELSRLLAKRWGELDASKKKVFEDEYALRQKAYHEILAKHKETGNGKVNLHLPDAPQKPKRVPSAYSLFVGEERKRLSKGAGKIDSSSLSLQCGANWRSLSTTERKTYEDRAAALKIDYETKMNAYRGSMKQYRKNAKTAEKEAARANGNVERPPITEGSSGPSSSVVEIPPVPERNKFGGKSPANMAPEPAKDRFLCLSSLSNDQPFYLKSGASQRCGFMSVFGQVDVIQTTFVDMDYISDADRTELDDWRDDEGEESEESSSESDSEEDSSESDSEESDGSEDSTSSESEESSSSGSEDAGSDAGEEKNTGAAAAAGEVEKTEVPQEPFDEAVEATREPDPLEGEPTGTGAPAAKPAEETGTDEAHAMATLPLLPKPRRPYKIKGQLMDWTLADGTHPKIYVSSNNSDVLASSQFQWEYDQAKASLDQEEYEDALLELEHIDYTLEEFVPPSVQRQQEEDEERARREAAAEDANISDLEEIGDDDSDDADSAGENLALNFDLSSVSMLDDLTFDEEDIDDGEVLV